MDVALKSREKQRAFNKGLRGSFTVELHLGPDAENATQALIEVVKVSDPTLDTHHTTLKISTTPEEPWNLNVDSSLVIDASFAAAENAQSQARAEELCAAAGGVVVSLQLIDGLGDSAREVSSDRFQVGGCN